MPATTPNRIQPDTPYPDAISYINDNFDKVVADLSDLGVAKYTSVGTQSFVLNSANLGAAVVNIVDPNNTYPNGINAVIPRLEIFVDTDNNDNFLYPNGASLSSGQLSFQSEIYIARRTYLGGSNPRASMVMVVRNLDSAQHTYFCHFDFAYQPNPATGQFR